MAAARPGVEHAAGPARDRDLVALVAMILSMSTLCCVSVSAEHWSAQLERPVGSNHTGEIHTGVSEHGYTMLVAC